MLKLKQPTPAFAIFASLLLLAFLDPFHYHPYRNFSNEALAIFSVISGLSLWGWTTKAPLRIPGAVVLPLGLILVIALQTINGFILYPVESLFAILYLLCFCVALVFGSTIRAAHEDLSELCFTLACTFILTSVISVIFQHVQLINLNWSPWVMPLAHDQNPRPFANIAQPNLLALLNCFSVASVWWLFLTRRINSWAAVGLAVVILIGIALTQSRIAWIILPLFVVLCWHQSEQRTRLYKLVLAFLLLFYIALVLYLPDIGSLVGIALDTSGHRATQTSVRLVLWQQAWTMSRLHPWFGVGWYQFGEQQVILSTLFKPTEYSEFAHNILLGFAAETGWPLTVLVFSLAAVWFYFCCIKRWHKLEVRFLSLILLAIFLHSLVEFPLWNAFILMPFGVIVGALHVRELGWKIVAIGRKWIVAFCVFSVVILVGVSADYYRVMIGFDALAWIQAGEKSGPGSIDPPLFTLYPQFYDYFQIIRIKISPDMPKEDIHFLETLSLRFAFPPVLHRLAMAYAYNQRPTEALQVITTIYHLHNGIYANEYAVWSTYAIQDPHYFGEIFKRLPKPNLAISVKSP